MNEVIDHPGVVKAIKDSETIIVNIVSISACSHCSSKEACTLNMSDMQEKEIEVKASPQKYPVGTNVMVQMKFGMGNLAVFLSYILPLILMLLAVFTTYGITSNEPLSGILGLVILIPYYLILYLLRDSISKKIRFTLKEE